MKKKIILLGANGFFGKNIISFFKNKYKIKKLFRGDSIDRINLKNYNYIINTAADVYDETTMFKNNTLLVNRVLEKIVCENKKIVFIHFGSSSEYGAINKKLAEKDLIIPRNIYEGTKAAATMLVQAYSKYYKLRTVIIRPFSVYGLYENKVRLMPNIILHFLKSQKLKIYNGYHDYIYIKDLMLFLQQLINRNLIREYGEIINFGGGKQYSNKRILELFEKHFNKKSSAIYIKKFQRSYDKKIWCSNNNYIKKKFNFKFKFDINTGIEDYIKNYKKNYN